MKFSALTLANLVVAATLLLTPFLVGLTSSAPYDPWYDLDENGKIDIFDLVRLAGTYGTTGDPGKNVNVTNWPEWMKTGTSLPTATGHLTARLNASVHGSSANPAGILRESKQITGLGSKNITFIGGSLSGGGSWVTYIAKLNGETPGVGRVEVHDAGDNLLAQFALPLDVMMNVEGVNKIVVYAESPIPYVTGDGGYSVCVVASVYWIEQ